VESVTYLGHFETGNDTERLEKFRDQVLGNHIIDTTHVYSTEGTIFSCISLTNSRLDLRDINFGLFQRIIRSEIPDTTFAMSCNTRFDICLTHVLIRKYWGWQKFTLGKLRKTVNS